MRTLLASTLLIGAACMGETSFAADIDLSERNAIYEFIAENLIDFQFVDKRNTAIADGSVATEFENTKSFTGLEKTAEGLRWSMVNVVKQRNWNLDSDGKRTGKPIVKDRVLTIVTELTVSRATGKLIGSRSSGTNTYTSFRGALEHVMAELDEGQLKLRGTTIGYSDFFEKGSDYYPGAAKFEETIYSKGDSTVIETSPRQLYRVDPATLEREATEVTPGHAITGERMEQ